MPESKTVGLYANTCMLRQKYENQHYFKKNHCIRNPSTKCWYPRTLYKHIYRVVFENSGPKNGRTQQVGLHHKPTDWREWCGLNEWPPTWHRAALSLAGTGRAPLCWICVISTNTWHSPAAMLSHFIPRGCPNTQSTKKPKEALISPIYTCQMGGGTCCVVYQLDS